MADKPKISDLLTLNELDELDGMELPPEFAAKLEAAVAVKKAAKEAQETANVAAGLNPDGSKRTKRGKERGKARSPSTNPSQSKYVELTMEEEMVSPPVGAPVVNGVPYIPERKVLVIRNKRGRIPMKMSSGIMMGIVEKLYRMRGRANACKDIGVHYGLFLTEFRENQAFRIAVQAAEKACWEDLDQLGYAEAMNGNQDILFKMWDRKKNSLQATRAWEIAKAEVKLKEQALEKGMNPTGGYGTPPPVDIGPALAEASTNQVAMFQKTMHALLNPPAPPAGEEGGSLPGAKTIETKESK